MPVQRRLPRAVQGHLKLELSCCTTVLAWGNVLSLGHLVHAGPHGFCTFLKAIPQALLWIGCNDGCKMRKAPASLRFDPHAHLQNVPAWLTWTENSVWEWHTIDNRNYFMCMQWCHGSGLDLGAEWSTLWTIEMAAETRGSQVDLTDQPRSHKEILG